MQPNGNVKKEAVWFLRTVIVTVKRAGMGKRKKNRKKEFKERCRCCESILAQNNVKYLPCMHHVVQNIL